MFLLTDNVAVSVDVGIGEDLNHPQVGSCNTGSTRVGEYVQIEHQRVSLSAPQLACSESRTQSCYLHTCQ